MSEFTQHQNIRIEKLTTYLNSLIAEENGKLLYEKYKHLTDKVFPEDIIISIDAVITKSASLELIKKAVSKFLHIYYKQLNSFPTITYAPNSLLFWLVQNNIELDNHLKEIRNFAKQLEKLQDSSFRTPFLSSIQKLQNIDKQYSVKENILFPLFEQNYKQHGCIKLMWSIHDDIRRRIKLLIQELSLKKPNSDLINKELGLLFFDIKAIIFREEKILFPTMNKLLDTQTQIILLKQSFDIGFAFVLPDVKFSGSSPQKKPESLDLELSTGNLSIEQLEMLFKHLPIDLTFVDENDKVRFYSDPPHRIFPRTKAIIGRKVQNCHPPESVDIVNQIVEAFRKGERNKASFWIHMGKRFILIEYFAMRDKSGKYKGVVEVSQEITEISQLQGDQRLLDWK